MLNRDTITLNLHLKKIVAYRNCTFLLKSKPSLNYTVECYSRCIRGPGLDRKLFIPPAHNEITTESESKHLGTFITNCHNVCIVFFFLNISPQQMGNEKNWPFTTASLWSTNVVNIENTHLVKGCPRG